MKFPLTCSLFFLAIPIFAEQATDEPSREIGSDATEVIRAVATPDIVNPANKTFLIEGLVLIKGGTNLESVKREHGIHIELGRQENKDLALILQNFLNAPLTADNLQAIKTAITNYYCQVENSYVAVVLPVQQIDDEVIVLQVFQAILDDVEYRDQRWFREGALRRALPIQKGDPIIESQLLDYVTWVNRNPFHHLRVILKPGSEPGTTSLEFVSKERYIIRPFAGADNTGFLLNKQARLYAGFTCGNTFGLGDLFSFQYIAAPNFHSFQSYVVSYTSFLSLEHQLTVFGCYGTVYPDVANFSVEGTNIQLSARYQIPVKPLYGDFRSNGTIGFDWKYLTSVYFFLGNAAEATSPVTSQIINITQFFFGYDFLMRWGNHALNLKADAYASIWKDLLPFQSNAAYEAQRPGSHVRYAYAQLSLDERYQFDSNWMLRGMFRGQMATNALPTSEQFGLGGADTVRGYYEQQFVADSAFCLNFECYAPTVSLMRSEEDELLFMAFVDYGLGRNFVSTSAPYKVQYLAGIGPGVHYSIIPYLNFKFEYGFQLKGVPQDRRIGRAHLSLNVSY